MTIKTDSIYAKPQQAVDGFVFDEAVSAVFDDMIQRSVPGYRTIISSIGMLAAQYSQPNTACYDLGCSLGAATLAMRHSITDDSCEIIALDNSPAMIDSCQQRINETPSPIAVDLQCADILQTRFKPCSVVVLNFTLQFIAPEERLDLIQRIYESLAVGGILILSEKIVFQHDEFDELFINMHHQYKKANGYSDLEISQKRTALENVLRPESLSAHKERLLGVGFKACDVWFQCFNFASMVAIK